MKDNYQIATRARIGVIIPSTNTGVEYDLRPFNLEGVSWHASRFWIELANWAEESDSSGDDENVVFERFLDTMRAEIPNSIRDVMSANITHLMLGMSAETFWGGEQGSREFEQQIKEQIGELGLTTGAVASHEALQAFKAKTISVITPYPKVGDDNVELFFSEQGYQVHKVVGLNCTSATAIAEITTNEVMHAVQQADADHVDAIVQCGTNLSTLDIFPELEQKMGKPLIPINIANTWHALRASGIKERISGYGRLLEEF